MQGAGISRIRLSTSLLASLEDEVRDLSFVGAHEDTPVFNEAGESVVASGGVVGKVTTSSKKRTKKKKKSGKGLPQDTVPLVHMQKEYGVLVGMNCVGYVKDARTTKLFATDLTKGAALVVWNSAMEAIMVDCTTVTDFRFLNDICDCFYNRLAPRKAVVFGSNPATDPCVYMQSGIGSVVAHFIIVYASEHMSPDNPARDVLMSTDLMFIPTKRKKGDGIFPSSFIDRTHPSNMLLDVEGKGKGEGLIQSKQPEASGTYCAPPRSYIDDVNMYTFFSVGNGAAVM